MNVFIDTNIFLNFYHFSSDDLSELNKMAILLRDKKITLLVTEQVMDEFYRNRDNKIADALREFRKEKLDRQFPQLIKQYEEYQKMRDSIKSFEENKQAILENLKHDVEENNLKADNLIDELFANANVISLTTRLFNQSKRRFDLGKPPGKSKSYGDSINWESLLSYLEEGSELVFVTGDGDYLSELDNSKFNSYLLNEWIIQKKSNLVLYRNLTSFFNENFPEIKLVDEYEKNLMIENLSLSASFARTHSVLAQLSTFENFSKDQVDDIIMAAVSNNQIYWISSDADVTETLGKIISRHKKIIDSDLLKRFYEIYKIE